MLTLSYQVIFSILAGLLLFVVANPKAVPFAYTLQLLPSLYRLLRPRIAMGRGEKSTASLPSPLHLFKHHVTYSRVNVTDLDVNMHKSNSTFFIDADISRAALLTRLFGRALAEVGSANLILAGVQCSFRREIRPFQRYAMSSRVLAWDEKWLFTVTYFLRPGCGLPVDSEVQGGPASVLLDEKLGKCVFAIMVTKYVAKAGRMTISPKRLLQSAGLLVLKADDGVVVEGGLVRQALGSGLQYVKDCM